MLSQPTPLADWIIILPVLLGLGGGALLLVARGVPRVQAWFSILVLMAIFACDLALLGRVLDRGPLTMTMGNWMPPFGISFTADVMGAGFALASAFVAICVTIYSMMDTPPAAVRSGYYSLLLILVAGVSGAFLTGDLFNLYVWFEVMLIASFGLIVLAGRPLQLDGAVKYGILNFLATALFLIGLGLLYGLVGTLNMADIIGRAATADAAPLASVAALFALAFGMKAAVFPVNAWLPASYHVPPASISALFAGLLTKVGVYALIRTLGMLLSAARDSLSPVLMAAAVLTAILGPLFALAETNLRRAFGFVLIGGVGVSLLALPHGDPTAMAGSVLYVFHAILTIAALYLVAGLIEHVTGTTDIRQMRSVYARNSALSAILLILLFAVSGLPPFLGFWPKLLILQGFSASQDWLPLFTLLLNALLTLTFSARLLSLLSHQNPHQNQSQPPALGMAAASLLTLVVVALGLLPESMIRAALLAGAEMANPTRYIASVGLAP